MTLVRRPSPFSELVTLRQAMDRLFDDTAFRPFTGPAGPDYARLPLDIRSTPEALLVEKAEQVRPRQIQIRPVISGHKIADSVAVETGTTVSPAGNGSAKA